MHIILVYEIRKKKFLIETWIIVAIENPNSNPCGMNDRMNHEGQPKLICCLRSKLNG